MIDLRPLFPLMTCALLAGCADPRPEFALSTQVAGGQLAYGAPTLAAAKRAFFGQDDTAETGDGADGPGLDLLSSDDPVTLQGNPPSVTQLTVSQVDQVAGVTVTTSLQAGYQHLDGTLPQGFGILTDPIQIEMWSQSLALQMMLGDSRQLPGGMTLSYAAGAGVAQVDAATHLQSALLDLRGRSRLTLPYTVVQGRLAGSGGASLQGDVVIFQSGAREVRLGVAQSF
jgi:hypothetical protein